MKKLLTTLISVTFLISIGFSYGNNDRTSSPARYYDNAKVVKVKYSQGDTYVKRSYDEGAEEAGVNIPIFEKDIVGTNMGRLDIYLGRSNFLRLDNDTEVEFHKLPKLRKTDMSIFIKRGGIYLDLFSLDYEKDVEIQTPDCGVFVLSKGVYRINFNGPRGTEVFVYDGAAEVAGTNYGKIVRENQKIVMRDGSVFERPYYFSSAEKDGFDSWNEERHNVANYARSGSSRYLSRGYEDTEYELTRQGRWRYNTTYNTYIWIPYNVGYDWRPYYNGRWVYTPYYGYVWYSYDPWGSYTYHYGRWQWNNFWGWYWIPGYRWSPAWVSWCYSGDYYGWSPLSYYNRPVIVINKRWLRNYNYRRGIPLRSMSTVVVRKNSLSSSIRRVAIRGNAKLNLKKSSLSYIGSSPAIRPTYRTVKVVNSKGRSMIFKKGGIISKKNFKTESPFGKRGTGTVYRYNKSGNSSGNPFKYSSGSLYKKNNTTGTTVKRYKSTGFSSTRYKVNRSNTGVSSTGYKSRGSSYKIKSYKSYGSKRSTSGSSSTSSSSSKKIKKKKNYPYFSADSYSSRNYSYSNGYSSRSSYYKPRTYKRYVSVPRNSYSGGNSSYTTNRYKSYTGSSSVFSGGNTSYRSYKYSSPYKYSKKYYGYGSKSISSYGYSPKKSYNYSSGKSYGYSPKRSYSFRGNSSYKRSSGKSFSVSSGSSSYRSSRSSSSRSSSGSSSSSSSRSFRKK